MHVIVIVVPDTWINAIFLRITILKLIMPRIIRQKIINLLHLSFALIANIDITLNIEEALVFKLAQDLQPLFIFGS